MLATPRNETRGMENRMLHEKSGFLNQALAGEHVDHGEINRSMNTFCIIIPMIIAMLNATGGNRSTYLYARFFPVRPGEVRADPEHLARRYIVVYNAAQDN